MSIQMSQQCRGKAQRSQGQEDELKPSACWRPAQQGFSDSKGEEADRSQPDRGLSHMDRFGLAIRTRHPQSPGSEIINMIGHDAHSSATY
jgi:hypothetical protein